MTIAFKTEIAGYEITLMQNSKGEFIVQYGYQTYQTQYYKQAARELGACIMHALMCDGKLGE